MAKTKEINENTSLFQLAWPIFFQSLFSMCIGWVDSAMLSRYSETAVGAIGNANQILNLLTLMFNIISSATGVIVAQYLGAKLQEKIGEIYTVALFFNIILSGVISLVILLFSNQMFKMMQIPDEMLPDALSYMYIVGGCIFVEALFGTFAAIFRSNGKTVIGMVVQFAVNILNIIGNYMFLYGPLSFLDWGVKGVAISSVFAKIVALVIGIVYFHKKIEGHISLKFLRPFPKAVLKSLLRLGIPSAGESISYSISQVFIMMFVNTMGVVAINTKIFGGILSNFAYLYSISVALATQIIVGHAVGANQYDYAYKRVLKTFRYALIISVCIAVVNFLISPVTFGIFAAEYENKREVIALGMQVMFVAIFLEIGRTGNLVIINSMRAAGDVKFPTILGMISMWGISVLLGYILGIVCDLGLVGIWIAMALDEIVRAVVVYIRWRKRTWEGKRVVPVEENNG